MHLILAPGLWLDGAIWTETATHLERRGHSTDALTLPGQGDGRTDATWEDQRAAVLAAVDRAADGPVWVVGHSAAAGLAWAAADARPERLAGVAMIGGFPVPDGETYAAFFPCAGGVMPFPGWDPFEGPDSDDLDAPAREGIAARAVAVPEAVAHGVVRLGDERRFDVPVALVCPEFSPAEAQASIDAGEQPELAAARRLTLWDLDSGHWPMVSCPARLATVLADAAEATAADAVGTGAD